MLNIKLARLDLGEVQNVVNDIEERKRGFSYGIDDGALILSHWCVGLAEKMNLIGDLTKQVWEKSFRGIAELDQLGHPLQISINFSTNGLNDLDIPEKVSESLIEYAIPPERVTIEVTESMLAKDMLTSMEILTRFRLKGMNLAIDDFGTGFSTLEQLQKIPFNELKIDRSFVHNADKNRVSLAILESSLNLANNLNLHTVAEGVEDEHDLDLVRVFDCERVQGTTLPVRCLSQN